MTIERRRGGSRIAQTRGLEWAASLLYELDVTRRQIRQLVDRRLHMQLNPVEETEYKRLIDLEIRLLHLRSDLAADI